MGVLLCLLHIDYMVFVEKFLRLLGRDGYGPFYGLVHSCIDMSAGAVLRRQSFFYGSVIGCPKVTHVKGYGVHAYSPAFQMG